MSGILVTVGVFLGGAAVAVVAVVGLVTSQTSSNNDPISGSTDTIVYNG